MVVRTELKLCTYSRSELLASSVLPACPIELIEGEHDYCPCRRRETHPAGRVEVRVLTCTWPRLYNGREVMNPQRFAEVTRQSCAMKLKTDRYLARLAEARKQEEQDLMGKQNGMQAPGKSAQVATREAEPPVQEAEIVAGEMVPAMGVTAAVAPIPPVREVVAVQSQPAPALATVAAPPPPRSLAAALALAQQKCRPARKDGRNAHHGYRYASADSIVAEAKAALAETGLALVPIETSLNRTDNGLELFRRLQLIHTSGESIVLACAWPVEVERGRPLDKATAIATTTSLAYLLRDLLMIPRQMPEGDMDSRTEAAKTAVSARAAKEQAQAVKEQPPASPPASTGTEKAITKEQMDKLATLRPQIFEAEKVKDEAKSARWKEIIGKYGVDSAAKLTATQADALILALASQLTTHDVQQALTASTKGG